MLTIAASDTIPRRTKDNSHSLVLQCDLKRMLSSILIMRSKSLEYLSPDDNLIQNCKGADLKRGAMV